MTTPPDVTGKTRKPRKPQKRLTGTARENVRIYAAMAYRRGDTIRTIAAATGRSYGNIRTLLVEAGVNLRPRSRTTSHPVGPILALRPEQETAEGAAPAPDLPVASRQVRR